MTAFVYLLFIYLLFIAMIPIDCKITNFSLHLFFCNNCNIGQLTSATSKERITTNIIFASASGEENKGKLLVEP